MQRTPTPRWRKSSYSGHSGGDCVEVANCFPLIEVRDSKDPDGPKLALPTAEWHGLIQRIKNGEPDLA
ncbi:DUF397 domain-containing protein [Actinomadura viridis]|uniref:DUF397 domain-containing protein n=1 Tax=Actinomadura viridis TaxID=58110 RepID=A0A931GPM4_9ACTN|nr:DUF397 domain-containing protein [Actinomadura viridis]MBG6087559.1 hypothetical protein [Actinomadura viridis]